MTFPLISEDGVKEIVIAVGVTSALTSRGGIGLGGAKKIPSA